MDRSAVLAAVIDEAPVCVFVADAEMRYVAVNRYACELLGYDEQEFLRLKVSDVATSNEASGEYHQMVKQAYMRGRSRLRCKDGEEFWLEYVAGEVEVDGRALYVSVGRAEFAE